MKKMGKSKIFLAVMSLFLLFFLAAGMDITAYANNNTFSGKREISYRLKESDLTCYCNNGREGFEFILRKELPDNMSYTITAEDRELVFKVYIGFDGFEEYFETMQTIAGEDINIIYKEGDDFTLIEPFGSEKVTEYLNNLFDSVGLFIEKKFDFLATYEGTKLYLNDTEYNCDDKVYISDHSMAGIVYNELDIRLERVKEDVEASVYAFVRLWDNEEDSLGEYIYFLKKNENITISDYSDTEYEINFTVSGENVDSVLNTIADYLGIYIDIRRTYEDAGMGVIKVAEEIEFVKDYVFNEDTYFSYESNLIGFHRNLASDNEDVEISDYELCTDGMFIIRYNYEIDGVIDEILIDTEILDKWGSVKRTITYRLSHNMAAIYHDRISGLIREKLAPGMTCEIFDDNTHRNYEISVVSDRDETITGFTQAFTGMRSSFMAVDGMFLFGKNSFCDTMKVDKDFFGMGEVSNVAVTYTKDGKVKTVDSTGIKEKYIDLSFKYNILTSRELMLLVIIGVGVIIVTVYILIFIGFIKKKFGKKAMPAIEEVKIAAEEMKAENEAGVMKDAAKVKDEEVSNDEKTEV